MVTGAHANAFTLLRICAALAVIFSHHFPVTGTQPPAWLHSNMVGGVAVMTFFTISGYLVTLSWLQDPRLLAFAGKRLLRLWPGIGINILAGGVLAVTLLVLLAGKYSALDGLSKFIMIALTASTVAAVAIAAANGGAPRAPDFIEASPWNMAALGFIIALMGWMPAPIEFSAINSLWVAVKRKLDHVSYQDGLFDFNVGYIGSALLALVFLAVGALVQYGTGTEVKMAGPAYIAQLIDMYARTIGDWSRWLVAFIAFFCMFGTTLTAVDGYSRANTEAFRLIKGETSYSTRALYLWTVLGCIAGMVVILFFKGALAPMLKFAMITAFLTTPVFAWLNLMLVRGGAHRISGGMLAFSWLGLIYLAGFAVLFLLQLVGVFG